MKRWYDPDEDNKEIAGTVAEGTCNPGRDEEQRLRRTSCSNAGLPPERSITGQEEAHLRGGGRLWCSLSLVYIVVGD